MKIDKLRKRIKKIGNSQGITFSSEEMNVYKFKVGDTLDISDIVKVNYKKLPKNQTKEQIKSEVKK